MIVKDDGCDELCWFCRKEPGQPQEAKKVKLHRGGPAAEPGYVAIEKSEVAVPRCATCSAGHFRVVKLALGAGAMTSVIAGILILGVRVGEFTPGVALAIVGGSGAAVAGLLVMAGPGLPAGQTSEDAAALHPGVLALVDRGWRIDDPALH